ncbi:glycosyltransferase family 2 protein, partial [Patescibacteria group bacterium]|nr:glycosyltransferase family 2 protein [Patescibacteria group bacterium]
MIDLSIVVVTYKENLDVLKECFDSVARSQHIGYELIVVDNGAKDATRGLLYSYPDSIYIRNQKNQGFAAAVNQGIKIAQGRYILLLNPDTSFGDNVLSRMVTHLDEDGDAGIASCLIRYPDGKLQESIRRFPRMIDQLFILFKVPHVFKRNRYVDRYMMREADATKTQDVDSIMGAFMLIRRDLLDEIGLFDERYFIWFEEVDYCKMAHDAGWKVRHYGDVEIKHHKGHSFSKIATLRKQKWIRTS